MKPKYGKVTSERNQNPSLIILVKTRTPLEAFQMLRQGHPIDVMAGHYQEQGLLAQDFWMMDHTAKLHALAYLRADNEQRQKDINSQIEEIKANQIKQQHETEEAARKANSEIAQRNNQQIQSSQGAVSQPGSGS